MIDARINSLWREFFSPLEAKQILDIPLTIYSIPDKFIWEKTMNEVSDLEVRYLSQGAPLYLVCFA